MVEVYKSCHKTRLVTLDSNEALARDVAQEEAGFRCQPGQEEIDEPVVIIVAECNTDDAPILNVIGNSEFISPFREIATIVDEKV